MNVPAVSAAATAMRDSALRPSVNLESVDIRVLSCKLFVRTQPAGPEAAAPPDL
jgi:hypothetical protein